MRELELLAPAKNLECGIAAIDHGADAVYIGAQRFGARAAAGNSLDDIRQLCQYAHLFRVKVYVTVNTIIYDEELTATQRMVNDLEEAGVDALLVQDMSLVGKTSIPLHASTQTDNRTPEKVAWLKSLGFERAVLARELSLDEISSIHHAVPDIDLEVFVHGALCVSYSGVCYASQYCFHRSANRGECAQFCRLKFDLVDSEGTEILHQRHLLSLKDLCQVDHLEEIAEAGASSFKIEGRLKDVDYVKNVVSAYSCRLNEVISRHPDHYRRASSGRVDYAFEPDLKKTFNRGFTTYFLQGRQPDIVSFDTPKAMGEYVGRVKELKNNSLTVAGTAAFSNGDGLCFVNEKHELEGFRVNRTEGNRLYPFKMPAHLRVGMGLYRNQDVAFEKLLSRETAVRKIHVDISFSARPAGFRAEMRLEDGHLLASADGNFSHQMAQKPQQDNIVRQLTKLGNTPFLCEHVEILEGADQYFIPNSFLSDLRRRLVENVKCFQPKREVRQPSPLLPVPMQGIEYKQYPYLYNISNHLSKSFYAKQGLKTITDAFERGGCGPHPLIMQCRYCIRYTLGYCVKRGGRPPVWHEPLYLRLPDGRQFRLQFQCSECQMNIYAE